MPLIDALKALAALLVMLNHFSSYGPLAANAREAVPVLFDGFYDYGRMAVQVFLVIAGFLAAKALSPNGMPLQCSPWPLIGKRYRRLVVPYGAALVLAIAASALARYWSNDPDIPTALTFSQLLAHILLLQGILGIESLSAGIWYLAIDFQLFALFTLLISLTGTRWLGPGLLLGLAAASLFWFNRDASLDNWAIYFFGAYGLGIAAWWFSGPNQRRYWLPILIVIVIGALLIDFRLRILLALIVALLLANARQQGWLWTWPDFAVLSWLGRISYALFLVHYPVLLLANTAYTTLGSNSAMNGLACLILALIASIGLADLFHRRIEGRGVDNAR
jgi:peptidoglycan/LPS O-acetylase OafA/YrhL